MNPKQQHGNHTWDLILHYHKCPACGYVFEDRNKFEKHFSTIQKKISCTRCQHAFLVIKNKKPTFGPFLGNDPEIID